MSRGSVIARRTRRRRSAELRLQPMLRDFRGRRADLHARRLLRPAPAALALSGPGPRRLRRAAPRDRPRRTSRPTLRVVPTATGFALEHEETSAARDATVARRLWLCEVRTAASPRWSATATAVGTTSCGPDTPPKRRWCGRDGATMATRTSTTTRPRRRRRRCPRRSPPGRADRGDRRTPRRPARRRSPRPGASGSPLPRQPRRARRRPADGCSVIETLARADGSTGLDGDDRRAALARPRRAARGPPSTGSSPTPDVSSPAPSTPAAPSSRRRRLPGHRPVGLRQRLRARHLVVRQLHRGARRRRAAAAHRRVLARRGVIEDTWNALGPAGTGSHHFHVDGVVVPAERTFVPMPATRASTTRRAHPGRRR